MQEKIGEGGFGYVHLATNKETNKQYAIKFMDMTQTCKFNKSIPSSNRQEILRTLRLTTLFFYRWVICVYILNLSKFHSNRSHPILHHIVHNADEVNSIYKEANSIKKLKHKNIVELYHAFVEGKQLIMIMELAKGGELMHHVQREGKLDEKTARNILIQIVNAI